VCVVGTCIDGEVFTRRLSISPRVKCSGNSSIWVMLTSSFRVCWSGVFVLEVKGYIAEYCV